MEKFIPKEKLSKKKKRELNAAKRNTWGALNPVTRKPENPKAYNRKKAQNRKDDFASVPLNFLCNMRTHERLSPFDINKWFNRFSQLFCALTIF